MSTEVNASSEHVKEIIDDQEIIFPGSTVSSVVYSEHPSRSVQIHHPDLQKMNQSSIRSLFARYGEIREFFVSELESRSTVIAAYYDIRNAKSALRALSLITINGITPEVHFSLPILDDQSQQTNPDDDFSNQGTLVVFNLDVNTSDDDISEIFSQHGEIKEIRETPNKRHHKFIEFYDTRHAAQAMKCLNKCEIKKKRIKIEPSRPGGARRSMIHTVHKRGKGNHNQSNYGGNYTRRHNERTNDNRGRSLSCAAGFNSTTSNSSNNGSTTTSNRSLLVESTLPFIPTASASSNPDTTSLSTPSSTSLGDSSSSPMPGFKNVTHSQQQGQTLLPHNGGLSSLSKTEVMSSDSTSPQVSSDFHENLAPSNPGPTMSTTENHPASIPSSLRGFMGASLFSIPSAPTTQPLPFSNGHMDGIGDSMNIGNESGVPGTNTESYSIFDQYDEMDHMGRPRLGSSYMGDEMGGDTLPFSANNDMYMEMSGAYGTSANGMVGHSPFSINAPDSHVHSIVGHSTSYHSNHSGVETDTNQTSTPYVPMEYIIPEKELTTVKVDLQVCIPSISKESVTKTLQDCDSLDFVDAIVVRHLQTTNIFVNCTNTAASQVFETLKSLHVCDFVHVDSHYPPNVPATGSISAAWAAVQGQRALSELFPDCVLKPNSTALWD